MDIMKGKGILYVLVFIIFSCGGEEQRKVRLHEYYDVEKIISLQVQKLDSLDPLVLKRVQIDQNVENETLRFRSKWGKELEIFRIGEINKPVFKGRYRKASYEEDNLRKIIYEPIEKPVSGLEYLKIAYKNDEQDIRSMEIFLKEENLLYKSVKKLTLTFKKNSSNDVLLDSYTITGYQKMIFRSLRTFKVEAVLNLEEK
jgi:hypothetical protein